MLNRAVEEGDKPLEKKARRAILKQSARERLHVRERAAKVLAEQRKQLSKRSRYAHEHLNMETKERNHVSSDTAKLLSSEG